MQKVVQCSNFSICISTFFFYAKLKVRNFHFLAASAPLILPCLSCFNVGLVQAVKLLQTLEAKTSLRVGSHWAWLLGLQGSMKKDPPPPHLIRAP